MRPCFARATSTSSSARGVPDFRSVGANVRPPLPTAVYSAVCVKSVTRTHTHARVLEDGNSCAACKALLLPPRTPLFFHISPLGSAVRTTVGPVRVVRSISARLRSLLVHVISRRRPSTFPLSHSFPRPSVANRKLHFFFRIRFFRPREIPPKRVIKENQKQTAK